jgi:hypothetical protein
LRLFRLPAAFEPPLPPGLPHASACLPHVEHDFSICYQQVVFQDSRADRVMQSATRYAAFAWFMPLCRLPKSAHDACAVPIIAVSLRDADMIIDASLLRRYFAVPAFMLPTERLIFADAIMSPDVFTLLPPRESSSAAAVFDRHASCHCHAIAMATRSLPRHR